MALSYSDRLAAEIDTFADQETIHDFSPIMDYYAARVIAPRLFDLGYQNSYDFFATNIARQERAAQTTSIVSYGCGNGELEVTVGEMLRSRGFDRFHFDCVDINEGMLERGRANAAKAGLSDKFTFLRGDATDVRLAAKRYDVHVAFQSLHHIENLEALFDKIESGMEDESIFLTNDMVGRNGHMRWPETLAVVEKLWSLLPYSYRYNHAFRRPELEFINFDCSAVGFEGIRAQDVFPLLAQRFEFEEVVGWGGIVDPFVDRSFGPNFNPNREADRRFIDLAIGLEQDLEKAGIVRPTQIIARLRRKGTAARPVDVTAALRLGPPAAMPNLDGIAFEFSRWRELVSHTMSGAPDAPYLGEGFWDWEENSGHRWSRRSFSLRFDVPIESIPYVCHFAAQFTAPRPEAAGALDVFVNRVRIAHIDAAYAAIAAHPDRSLSVSFATLGGPTTVTFVFEKPQHPAGSTDWRELGVVVRRFSVVAEAA